MAKLKKSIKAINFDLDNELLQANYPSKSYKYAWTKIRKALEGMGFEHKQYSGYLSLKPLSNKDIQVVVEKLVRQNPWLSKCIQQFDVTDVGPQYEMKRFIENLDDKGYDSDLDKQPEERTGKE